MPTISDVSSGSDSDDDEEEEVEIIQPTVGEHMQGAIDTVYAKGAAGLLYIKPFAHVAWIPFVLWLGSSEPPHPSLFQMLSPPM